jgi:uncharacterized NAD(P)/FAD-binding protein YdhS
MDNSQASKPMKRPTVAIVGGGCSGTLVALQLLKQSHANPLDIVIIERSGRVGPGLAYSVPSDVCKLNVPANAMGAFPEDPAGFLTWLQHRDPHIQGDEFVSRRLFGEYLQELFASYSTSAQHATVTTVADSVTDLVWDKSQAQFRLELSTAAPLRADLCVLALGNIERESLDGIAIKHLFSSPYEEQSYNDIAQRKKLLIVGSSLTAIDAILEAEARGFRGEYTMVSRHGRIPLAHEAAASFAHVSLDSRLGVVGVLTSLSLRDLVRLIKTEALRLGSSQPVIAALRPHIQSIWAGLSNADKSRFLRHVRPLWEVHRHRIPKPHWDTIESLRATRRLQIVAGRVQSVKKSDAGVEATIITKKSREQTIFDQAFICAGPEGDLAKVQMPLIQKLIARGTITPGALRLGVAPDGISLPEGAASRLHIVGPLQREALWEITAVRELRIQAEKTAVSIAASCDPLH